MKPSEMTPLQVIHESLVSESEAWRRNSEDPCGINLPVSVALDATAQAVRKAMKSEKPVKLFAAEEIGRAALLVLAMMGVASGVMAQRFGSWQEGLMDFGVAIGVLMVRSWVGKR